MTPIFSTSPKAQAAYGIVKNLQHALVSAMDRLPPSSSSSRFVPVSWLRAQGRFGGGTRFMAQDSKLFNRASVNISQVQYEQDSSKKLNSASAISAIIHPSHPLAPSIHMHISWTEMKDHRGYWRIMADLNPSIPNSKHTDLFRQTIKEAAGDLYDEGSSQGDQYFFIPALRRCRGVVHFYLEQLSRDIEKDPVFAQNFGVKVISRYKEILDDALTSSATCTPEDQQKQLEYHTLYFLQVLTLDRGTTSGLLVHDENDIGILGSLPSHINRTLLNVWTPLHPPLQQKLIEGILKALPKEELCLVDDHVKSEIAQWMRRFYQLHPEAQDLLARGKILPPTVSNHLG